jgi:RND family efflux transporter MFP subunit
MSRTSQVAFKTNKSFALLFQPRGVSRIKAVPNARLIALFLWLVGFNSNQLMADPVPVLTQKLGSLLTPMTYSAPATVKPFNRPQLTAEVTGRILRMPIRVGEIAKAGQVLVELECKVHEQKERTVLAALRRARVQTQFAAAQLKRAEGLKQKSSISEELLEQRRMELAIARADLATQLAQTELAGIDVQRCLISAPFDAVISQRLGSEGSLATPGMPLLELVQLSQLEVSAELRANQAQTLSGALQPVFSYQGTDYPLELRALPPLIDERTRTREARLVFTQQSAPVGAAGRLHWTSNIRQLPGHYLVRRDDQLGVFLAREGNAVFVGVPGAREGQPANIELDDDELLITEGRQRLNDGDDIVPKRAGNDT